MVAEEIEQRLGSRASKILSMRPGLTGIWQTTGRSVTIDYEARIAMDEHYIDRSTLLLDLKLILKTIPCMLLSKGA
jgi:undecaprenyl-phosphate galactose phosphotransferase